MFEYEIQGSKGGAPKPHTPVETPNNLLSVAYAKVLIAIAEGELAGEPTAKDIYLDGTPLANEDGSLNFGGVKWEWRPGTTDQEYIAGLPEVSTEYNVGVELKTNTPWVRQVTKTQLDAVRVTFQWPALMKQESNGDTVGIVMEYAIDVATDGGAFVEYQKYTIDGKTNTQYERTHRVDLPKANTGWTVRARRITPEDDSSTVQDTVNIKSYAEVVDVKQRYPNTALLYVEFDSRLFGGGSIPRVSVRTKGRVIQVPSNYDPETRAYVGVWAGDFKWAWTDNPAWVFYDLVTQNRFGLGHKVDANMIDKWALYEVAQYCDVLVDDGTGAGTKEPRHTCNIYIQEKSDAWRVLRDIAGIFNGMTYWNGNQFVAIADKEEDITNIPVFSRSNVVDGQFTYQAADDKSIYTSALVSYDDPENHYNTEVEATFETSQILRWGGDRQVELSAIGCTSRGEAQRKGKYTLITNMYNRTVTFRTGLQGLDDKVLPGKIIHVVDPLIGGKPFTGRIRIATGRVVTLDRDIEAAAGDILYLTRNDGSSEGRTIESVAGNIVTVTVAYSENPQPNSVWYLESSLLKSQLFRVVKISSPQESVFEIEAVEYNESKFGAIDNGARLEPRPISVTPPTVQAAPSEVTITSNTYTEQTMAVTTMTISWPQVPKATLYEGQWKVGNGEWVTLGTTGALQFTVKGVYTGDYVARVRAVNAYDIKSVWTMSATTRLNGKDGGVPALASLTTTPIIYGIRLNWEFPEGAEDTARTEIMYSVNTNFADAIKLGDYSYPTDMHEMHGLKAGQQFWFWGRLVDRSGNVGPWKPLESAIGVHGTSSVDQSEYQEYFEKQINESALYDLLNDRIDLIDGPPTLPGSVNQRVKVVSDKVAQDVSTLNQTIADLDAELTNQINSVQQDLQTQIDAIDMSNTMPYDPTATYTTSQVVLGADRILYQAKQNVPLNTPPPNTTYWLDIGQAVITADGLASRVTTAEQNITNLDGRVTANSTSITGLQSQINGKADATALNSLTTRVATAEGKIETNAQAITGLQTSVAGKADTSALNALTTRVQTAEGKIDANTSAITNLTTTVNGKADASAVTALSTRVTEAEGNISSQGNAITTLNNQIGNIGGDNLLANSSFEEIVNNTRGKYWNILAAGGTTTPSMVDSPLPQSIKAQRTESSSINPNGYLDVLYINDGIARPKVTAGKQYTLSAWARGTSGQVFRQYMRFYDAAGAIIVTPTILQASLTETFQRYVFTYTAPANSATATVYAARIINGGSSAIPLWMEVDNVQFQEGAVATAYTPSVTQSVTALADATSALTTRVSTVEGTVTTQGQSITSLTNRITDAESDIDGQATAISSLQSSVTSVDGKVTVLASSIDSLTAAYRDDDGVGDQNDAMNSWNTLANVTESRKVFADEQIATAERFSSVEAQLGTTSASVTNLEQAVATQNSANASKFTQLESSLTIAQTDATNALNQVSTKADASAVTALTTRVDNVEGTVTSQSQSITELKSSVNNIGAGGLDGAAGGVWQFDSTIEGWTPANSTLTPGVGFVTQTATANDPSMTSPIISINGGLYQRIKAKITRRAGAISDWDSSLFYSTTNHSISSSYIARTNNPNIAVGETAIVEWDMANLFVGGTDWINSTITRIRIDFGSVAGGSFDIDWIAIGRQGPGASAQALQQVTTSVTQQGADLVAQTTRIDGIYAQVNPEMVGDSTVLIGRSTKLVGIWTEQSARVEGDVAIGTSVTNLQAQVGDNTSAIQQISSVTTSLDGKTSAMWGVKMEVNSQGQYVAAGIGLGIENGPAGLQSQFLVSADKFAVVNGVNGTVTAPFVVTGGQVFIREALITTAMITNALIGSSITSQTQAAWAGLPATVMTFAGEGSLVMRNPSRANTYVTHTPQASTWVIDGVTRVRIGSW